MNGKSLKYIFSSYFLFVFQFAFIFEAKFVQLNTFGMIINLTRWSVNLSSSHSDFPLGIIYGPFWRSFADRGSFGVLYSTPKNGVFTFNSALQVESYTHHDSVLVDRFLNYYSICHRGLTKKHTITIICAHCKNNFEGTIWGKKTIN